MEKLFLFITGYILIFPAQAQVMWQFNKDTVITWQYEWGDEFNGTKIDEKKWAYWQGSRSIYTNLEQEYYTDGKNHLMENGVLKLVARKEKVEAKMVDWMSEKDSLKGDGKFFGLNTWKFDYTSGMIISNKLFTKGYFEIRFKAPSDKGMWPAFWLAGGDPNEEIDVFELKGERPDKIHFDIHCPNDCDYFKTWYGKKQNWGGWASFTKNLTDEFNVIGIVWQPNFINFFLNGKSIAYVPVSFSVPKFLEANLAIPSDNGPFHPGPKKDFTQSSPFEIDYIRVWGLAEASGNKSKLLAEHTPTVFSELKQGESKLKKKQKFLYGKKAIHKNEGPFVSVFPVNKTNFVLYASGLEKDKQVELELKNSEKKTVYSVKTNTFQTKLDFSALPAGNYTLSVLCNLKTASVEIGL